MFAEERLLLDDGCIDATRSQLLLCGSELLKSSFEEGGALGR